MINKKDIILIGYSGHSYVCIDTIKLNQFNIKGYCDSLLKESNPYFLNYLGDEEKYQIQKNDFFFISIGENTIRKNIYNKLKTNNFINVIHPSSNISESVFIKENSNVLVNANVVINAQSKICKGVILNTGAIIEHECKIGDFSHIGPGAVICGNVNIGERTFVGSNTVIKQGVNIGNNVTIGAGSVIIKDIADNKKVVGNPGKIIN